MVCTVLTRRRMQNAVRYERLSYVDVLAKGLKVMDASAVALAQDNNLPVVIFNMHGRGAFSSVVKGEGLYTVISKET